MASVVAPAAAEQVAVPIAAPEREPGRLARLVHQLLRQTPSWLVSMVLHTVMLLVLALLTLPPPPSDELRQLVVAPGEEEPVEMIETLEEAPEEINVEVAEAVFETAVPQQMDVSPMDQMEAAAVSVQLSDFGLEHAPRSDVLGQIGAFSGNAFEGRGAGKARLLAEAGGTEGSEQAVALALEWLAAHQLPDGSWCFDQRAVPNCRGQCRHPGDLTNARIGATALALLPFLGAGQTHRQGKYRNQVQAGLYFLVNQMKVGPEGGNLHEPGGNMYSHGLASIALCEAYAMTRDRGLFGPAQQALNFICYAQDPVGGGWRYQPRQPGDTSVVGWQLMALKSGHMAYLRVPPITIQRAVRFLDSVQANDGANYGYTSPGQGPGTTAVGLLCRMYLGWPKDHPALERGVRWLAERGPSKTDMYYNYYATQVLRHLEGDLWKKWNAQMRDWLVSTQAKEGHERGSWWVDGGHQTERGGRLYVTCMAAMILEVYYRHMPIYRKQSVEESFPLD
ncbi:MAG: terpene cyclase/mutase family protein [Thermoguttaceae bacterium]|nr:terpene cyclase/mutase family protein [Thermoguttaceae bacterium]MDW8077914.1 terpene cyclase/mutase family protein [Thermoguttaceae bacterium]